MARKVLIHKNTNLTTNNGGVLSPKLPTAGTLQKGEIAVNYKDGYETLSIENDLGEVVPFASLEQIISYVDNSLPDLELSSNYSTSDLENEDLQLAEGDSYEEAFSKIEKAILDNEETIATSLNDLNTRKIEIDDVPTKTSQLTNDSGYITSFTETDPTVPSHVKGITTTDISNWNGKQAAIADLSDIRNGAALGATALLSYTETDPTVPAWAKAANKPSYTAAEVGALPDTYTPPVTSVNGQTGAVNLTIPSAPGTLNTTATTAQSTSSSEALSGNITLHKIAKTGTYNDLIGKPTIPAAVTESTVAGWGFTKNTGTYSKPSGGIPASDLAAGVIPIELDIDNSVLTGKETTIRAIEASDGVYALGQNNADGTEDYVLATTDQLPTVPTNVSAFTNDAGYTTNTGTITGITMNGANKGTSGVVNLGTVLTEHQTLKTINNESIVGTGNLSVPGLPTVTSSDNGKVLQVVNGVWSLVMPTAIYSGTSTPNNSVGNDGDLYLQTS